MPRTHLSSLAVIMLAALATLAATGGSKSDDMARALASITEEGIQADVGVLASDEFQGRGPATPGEEKAVRYIEQRFKELGLKPGNGGSWVQEIPLTQITSSPASDLAIEGADGTKRYRYHDEFVASTRRMVERAGIDGSEMVFVGYGIVAPEWKWDDYKGVDVRGKTVVMLINDPGFATKDPKLFDGDAMTYYGRWTYKYDEAARHGAAGVFIVHETEPASYPWAVVDNSFTGPQMNFTAADKNMSYAAIEGWLAIDAARSVFSRAGLDFDKAKASACRRDFAPMPMGLRASVAVNNGIRNVVSRNVLGLLPGGSRADQCIIYTAHWDHLGMDTTRAGDRIFNGARDNASGVAGILEIANAFTKLSAPPSRSVLFIAVTCEEQGLLGSEYYAEHPVFPLDRTAAAFNIDAVNIWGRMKDVTVTGYGNTVLDDYLADAAKTQDRVVRPGSEPSKGFFFRSDQFSLAQRGVPVLYLDGGTDSREHGSAWTNAQRDAFTTERYHKPSDELGPWWDLSGAVEDLRLLFLVGHRVAEQPSFPQWKKDAPFKPQPGTHMRS
jgi:Zn-dependent M28 family amino/carboxypeptidase